MEGDDQKAHIRYAEEAAASSSSSRPQLTRQTSNSLSIHSVYNRVASPENLLPITYRTLLGPFQFYSISSGFRF